MQQSSNHLKAKDATKKLRRYKLVIKREKFLNLKYTDFYESI